MTPEPTPDPDPEPDPEPSDTVTVTYRVSNAKSSTTWLNTNTTWASGNVVSGSSKATNSVGDYVCTVPKGSYYLYISGANWSSYYVRAGDGSLSNPIALSSVTNGSQNGSRSTNAISIQSDKTIIIDITLDD